MQATGGSTGAGRQAQGRSTIMSFTGGLRQRICAALPLAAKLALVAGVSSALLLPAQAQFWGGWGGGNYPQRQVPPRPVPQQPPQYNPFGNFFGNGQQRKREAPADYSHAPTPSRKADASITTPIVVMGDGMADWLAYGLEDAFSEQPEVGIVRKNRTSSGLIHYDQRRETEWTQIAKEIITADKPKFIVMMIGVNDRQAIRERAPAPAAKHSAAQQPQASAPQQPDKLDPETMAQQSADQQNAELEAKAEPPPPPEPERKSAAHGGNAGPFEFHSEQWEAAYIKRIDATIAVLKSAGVPVFWVGLPAQRNSRASADSAYLNDLYRQRADKAGIVYVDVWDGFVDEAGRYTAQGPDFEGQIRRLRSGDGVYFTKAGARKLAHYVEREIQRSMTNRAVPVALPAPEPAVQSPGARRGAPAPRPVAGPVVPLTVSTGDGNELLGGGRGTRPPATDPIANRVLIRGEPTHAQSGRADDFSWPRGSNSAVSPEPEIAVSAPAGASKANASAAPAPTSGTGTSAGEPKAARTSSGHRTATETQGNETPQPAKKRARPAEKGPRPPMAISPSASRGWNGWFR